MVGVTGGEGRWMAVHAESSRGLGGCWFGGWDSAERFCALNDMHRNHEAVTCPSHGSVLIVVFLFSLFCSAGAARRSHPG